MKANDQAGRIARLLAAAAITVVLAACSQRTPPPAPAPVQTASRTPSPAPLPPAPTPAADWRDAPIAPGTWRWAMVEGRSTASFGQPGAAPLLTLACDRTTATVRLVHAGTIAGQVPLGITTTSGSYPLMTDAAAAAMGQIAATIPARARLLEAMAFSRGRFAIEVPGFAPSYVPAWPEVSRVVEDCR